jgi:hypothetical protein
VTIGNINKKRKGVLSAMKYSHSIVIDRPRGKVLELMMETEHLPKWQRGLAKVESLEGEPFTLNAKTQLVFDTGKKTLKMTETLVDMRLPDAYTAIYETDELWNRVTNMFSEVDGKTLWSTDNEFVFSGLMRYLGPLMKKSFIKRTEYEMARFKEFVETHDQPETVESAPAEAASSHMSGEALESNELHASQEPLETSTQEEDRG